MSAYNFQAAIVPVLAKLSALEGIAASAPTTAAIPVTLKSVSQYRHAGIAEETIVDLSRKVAEYDRENQTQSRSLKAEAAGLSSSQYGAYLQLAEQNGETVRKAKDIRDEAYQRGIALIEEEGLSRTATYERLAAEFGYSASTMGKQFRVAEKDLLESHLEFVASDAPAGSYAAPQKILFGERITPSGIKTGLAAVAMLLISSVFSLSKPSSYTVPPVPDSHISHYEAVSTGAATGPEPNPKHSSPLLKSLIQGYNQLDGIVTKSSGRYWVTVDTDKFPGGTTYDSPDLILIQKVLEQHGYQPVRDHDFKYQKAAAGTVAETSPSKSTPQTKTEVHSPGIKVADTQVASAAPQLDDRQYVKDDAAMQRIEAASSETKVTPASQISYAGKKPTYSRHATADVSTAASPLEKTVAAASAITSKRGGLLSAVKKGFSAIGGLFYQSYDAQIQEADAAAATLENRALAQNQAMHSDQYSFSNLLNQNEGRLLLQILSNSGLEREWFRGPVTANDIASKLASYGLGPQAGWHPHDRLTAERIASIYAGMTGRDAREAYSLNETQLITKLSQAAYQKVKHPTRKESASRVLPGTIPSATWFTSIEIDPNHLRLEIEGKPISYTDPNGKKHSVYVNRENEVRVKRALCDTRIGGINPETLELSIDPQHSAHLSTNVTHATLGNLYHKDPPKPGPDGIKYLPQITGIPIGFEMRRIHVEGSRSSRVRYELVDTRTGELAALYSSRFENPTYSTLHTFVSYPLMADLVNDRFTNTGILTSDGQPIVESADHRYFRTWQGRIIQGLAKSTVQDAMHVQNTILPTRGQKFIPTRTPTPAAKTVSVKMVRR
ncbi:MAG TPA: hypothetical protein VJH97_04845 [Candidatus Nanoarchaeia archaeon]|nr:hypothetical protein [Candidatus Nanoarchaeia archaeon]